jgi:hypothetical protein
MDKRTQILGLMFLLLFGCASCVEMEKADETWESPGPIKIRIVLKYSLGNDYYFFEARENEKGRWKRIMRVWRDATGAMPVENVRILNAEVGYLFLVDQVAVTKDGGNNWALFNTSEHFDCEWDGCSNIQAVNLSITGTGNLRGLRRVGTEWVEYRLATTDCGITWVTT